MLSLHIEAFLVSRGVVAMDRTAVGIVSKGESFVGEVVVVDRSLVDAFD
jgi:hypothetical protein